MPLEQIRQLAHDLFDALTQERTVDAQTGYELGRLSAVLTMLSTRPPVADLDGRAAAPAVTQARNGTTAPPAVIQSPRSTEQRVRVEKRPMRHAERVLEGPGGHKVVYNFERLEIRDGTKRETVASRKELWDRLKKQKREFRRKSAAKT